MKKSDLRNGMIVKTSSGRYGLVVIKDATSKDCIKFLYDPAYLLNNGCLYNTGSFIEPLDSFDDSLNCYAYATDSDERDFDNIKAGDKLILWQIIEVYGLNSLWIRNNLQPSVGGLFGDNE